MANIRYLASTHRIGSTLEDLGGVQPSFLAYLKVEVYRATHGRWAEWLPLALLERLAAHFAENQEALAMALDALAPEALEELAALPPPSAVDYSDPFADVGTIWLHDWEHWEHEQQVRFVTQLLRPAGPH